MKIYVKDPDKFLGFIFITMFAILIFAAFKFWVFETLKKTLIWFVALVICAGIFTYLSSVVREE